MRVCLGGTFDPLHAGHRALLDAAFEAAGPDGHVFVGLVSDDFAARKKSRKIEPYASREKAILSYAADRSPAPELVVRPLNDEHGPSAEGDYDIIVASPETKATAERINEVRGQAGRSALKILTVPFVLGPDLLPVNASRIRRGLIDVEGRRAKPLIVAAGTQNPTKLRAIRTAFGRFMPQVDVSVRGQEVETGVPEQPFGDDTWAGAKRRADAALDALRDAEAEYGVGIEAGLFADPLTGLLMDVQHCVITDRTGFITHGHGPGFTYPPTIGDQVRTASKTIEEVVGALAGDPQIGKSQGAVGYLSRNVLERTRLTEAAVEAALVPRRRRDLYA